MNFHPIWIEPLTKNLSPATPRPERNSSSCYWALVIEDRNKHYYWAKGVSLEISFEVYTQVLVNPKLFNGSTSHALHKQIEGLKKVDAITRIAR
jgi:hypothetical protein